LRVMALLHVASGEDAQARNCFEQSLALLHDLEESADLARVRFYYGRYLLAQGEHGAAMTHLRAASRAFRRLGIVAEGYEVNHLLFRQEMGVDREMALMQGISWLMSLGDEPQALLEAAMRMLLEAFGFESAAILVRGKPVLTLGNPSLERLPESDESQEVVKTDSVLSWPVRCDGSLLGRIQLERAAPVATENSLLVLDAIANLLASPILRLTELDAGVAEERPELAGLRYRGLLGRNQRMLDVLAKVRAVASEGVPVLIRGESGTGKELVARALHESGARVGRPFEAVNCAGVPEDLLEVEFFGVEQGTTNSAAGHKGKLETADGGTVFIDEIGDLSPTLQAKLLRALQERTFVRVGGTAPVRVDVRLVAATEKTLGELAGQRKFRDEILDRLNGVELVLPALNERPEDVPDLVRHFVQSSSREFGRHVVDVSPEVMARLATHRWPGNVRDLKYVIERSVLSARAETVQLGDLPPNLRPLPSASPEPKPAD
jgi:transcriptional regulator with GAF, ATPase, and Fis domain